MMRRRVVITGMGAVTPGGNDALSTWEFLREGRSAVETLDWLEKEDCRPKIGARVKGFQPEKLGLKQDALRIARCSQLALGAALEAWKEAGFQAGCLDARRAGVLIGTGVGDAAEHFRQGEQYRSRGMRGVHPLYVPRVMPNAPTGHVALELGLRGPSFATVTACAAGAHAIGLATRLIQWGEADVVVAGGTEEMSLPAYAGFASLHTLSCRNETPQKASRPFDRDRDGFVMGEGAGVVVLEELGHARRRAGRILAEIAGFGMTSDAHHITAPDPSGEGAARAMSLAIADAGRRPEDVQYVNAHGTSTPLNDRIESRAIRAVFNGHADALAVSATKSMVGHLLGAAGAVGLIATVKSILHRVAHPTVNLENPDPECDLDYVPHRSRHLEVEMALVNAFGFGGHCATLAVRRFDER